MFRSIQKKHKRNTRGVVASAILIALLLIATASAALSFDYAHGVLVREQLQKAVDAAALAGVYELARTTVSGQDKKNAEAYAYQVASQNSADNASVANSVPGTIVSVTINANTMPRTVTVTATKTTANFFARLFGADTMPVSATATAQALKGLKQIKPNQLMPLAVSLDYVPTSGPQKGVSLNSLRGPNVYKQKFTLVLNPQGAKNASWLKNWNPNQNPLLTIGGDTLIMNGTNANLVMNNLKPGTTINIPLILGGPPFNQQRPPVGVIGFKITRVNFPQEIEGYIKDPLVMSGTPGTPVMDYVSAEDNAFLTQTSPWQIQLIN